MNERAVSSGTGSVVFIDDVPEELYRNSFSSQSRPAKLTEQDFTLDSDPQHAAKEARELLKLKKWKWEEVRHSMSQRHHIWHFIYDYYSPSPFETPKIENYLS